MKGISKTLSACILVTITIASLTFLFWNLIAQFYQVHIFVQETNTERQNINLANVLISHENFTVDKNKTVFYSYIPAKIDGEIKDQPSKSIFYAERGILDPKKLDEISYKISDEAEIFDEYYQALIDFKTLDIGYPNSQVLLGVINYDECVPSTLEISPSESIYFCPGWIGSFRGPITLKATSIYKFVSCLADNLDMGLGSIFRFVQYGPLGTLWQPINFGKCENYLIEEEKIRFLFSSGGLNTRGLPILLKDGDTYKIGRLFVGVMKWY